MLMKIRKREESGRIVELMAEVTEWIDDRGAQLATATRTSLNGHKTWHYVPAYRDTDGLVWRSVSRTFNRNQAYMF